jgi:hypothetical protein
VTVLVSTRLPAQVRDEVRAAAGALGATTADFTDGAPIPPAASAIIAGLPPGSRRIPAELARAAERTSLRIVLCAGEPMVRPVTTLLGGRVVVIAPPFEPERLRQGLRAAAAGSGEPVRFAGDAGQSLSSEWWFAWARHPGHATGVEALESAIDVTLLFGARCTAAQAAQAGEVLKTAVGDDALERDLATTVEDIAVVRLAPTLGEWVVYWPAASRALWLCSPWRAPARWNLAKSIEAGGRRVTRVPAYPEDVLVACDDAPSVEAIVTAAARGAPEAYASLRGLAAGTRLAGAIVEAR